MMILTILGIFLINSVTSSKEGYDVDFGDEQEEGSESNFPSFHAQGKSFHD